MDAFANPRFRANQTGETNIHILPWRDIYFDINKNGLIAFIFPFDLSLLTRWQCLISHPRTFSESD